MESNKEQKMETINSIAQIMEAFPTGKIYVRWSDSIALDQKREYSLRYGTDAEAGLSACEIDLSWETWRIVRQIMEYKFTGGKYCYLITGDRVGVGGDNEPLINNIKSVYKVGNGLLTFDWQRAQLESYIADATDRLSRITDKIAIEIVSDTKIKYMKLLNKYLSGSRINFVA